MKGWDRIPRFSERSKQAESVRRSNTQSIISSIFRIGNDSVSPFVVDCFFQFQYSNNNNNSNSMTTSANSEESGSHDYERSMDTSMNSLSTSMNSSIYSNIALPIAHALRLQETDIISWEGDFLGAGYFFGGRGFFDFLFLIQIV